MLPYAVAAVQRGFWIFPVEPNAKTPLVMHNGFRIRWSEVATNDLSCVANWWGYCPWANVGIAAKPSGLLVVDCDEGEGKNGLNQYIEITSMYAGMDAYKAFETYTVRTGGGGLHFYYGWPPNVQASQSGLDKDVDIRSNGGMRGGYVLGAGSVTEKGSYELEFDHPVIAVPSWLQELCTDRPRPKPIPSGYGHPVGGDFSGLVTKLRLTGEGNRNDMLCYAARCMCEEGASEERAHELLTPAAESVGLAAGEIRSTIHSAYRVQSARG